MSNAFNQRRRRRRPHINITSLIDVMFLLLIFFMVSATFRNTFAIDVELPEAVTGAEEDRPVHELIVTAEGKYVLDDREVSDDALRAVLADLANAEPEARIRLTADASANWARAVRVMDVAREVGSRQLIIATQPPEGGATP